MQVCPLLQADNHASTHHSVFTDWMPFLPPIQQRQSTEGNAIVIWKCMIYKTIKQYWLCAFSVHNSMLETLVVYTYCDVNTQRRTEPQITCTGKRSLDMCISRYVSKLTDRQTYMLIAMLHTPSRGCKCSAVWTLWCKRKVKKVKYTDMAVRLPSHTAIVLCCLRLWACWSVAVVWTFFSRFCRFRHCLHSLFSC